jgi:hypothetical protein
MGTTAETFVIKRIYDAPADDDGCRVPVLLEFILKHRQLRCR